MDLLRSQNKKPIFFDDFSLIESLKRIKAGGRGLMIFHLILGIKLQIPPPRIPGERASIPSVEVENREREVACSTSDGQGSKLEFCVWRVHDE